MLFIGKKQAGYFCEDVVKSLDRTVEFTGQLKRMAEVGEKVYRQRYTYYVIDLTELIEEEEVIVGEMIKLREVSSGKIICYASGYSPQSSLLVSLRAAGFLEVITHVHLSGMKQELEDILLEKQPPISVIEPVQGSSEGIKESYSRKASIAIVGTQSRIGTTTMAFVLAKYIQYQGHKVCYIQMNHTKYVETMEQCYQVESNPDLGLVRYKNLDMYYRLEFLPQIVKKGYDFYLYDYGEVKEFNLVSFLEKDMKLIVAGVKPNEILLTNQILQNEKIKEDYYIFNFCDKDEEEDILELMEEKKEVTYFLEYTPDPFLFIDNKNVFLKEILRLEKREFEKKKFHFFGKKRN